MVMKLSDSSLKLGAARKRNRLINTLVVAFLVMAGVEQIAKVQYRNFVLANGGETNPTWVGWKYFMTPCSSWDGCSIGHGTTRLSEIGGPHIVFETYSVLWFKARRFIY